jgi:hypothetical protein
MGTENKAPKIVTLRFGRERSTKHAMGREVEQNLHQ